MREAQQATAAFTLDEWMKALEEASRPTGEGPAGFTTQDVMRVSGVGDCTARKTMRKLFDAGRIALAGTRPMQRMSGGTYPVPVYRFVKAEKPKPKRRRRP